MTSVPQFSIIIPVYNDWKPLDEALLSLSRQAAAPSFEVVIVDDGSAEEVPDTIRQWSQHYPLTIIRQSHKGIPTARNCGIQNAKGSVLVFTDADCRLQPDCLAALDTAILQFPQQNYFQLRLIGDSSNTVGRAEELRLATLQKRMRQPDGCIRYLNTAGFAVRHERVDRNAGLFDPAALRAEDTLLLADLVQSGQLPFFAEEAVVQHLVSLSFSRCIRKDVRSAWRQAKTDEIIAARGIRVRMTHKDRVGMLRLAWDASRNPSIGRRAWFTLVTRQSVERIVSFCHRCFAIGQPPKPRPSPFVQSTSRAQPDDVRR
jgi:glycosyltransferase involved in cell wall biosynthesis